MDFYDDDMDMYGDDMDYMPYEDDSEFFQPMDLPVRLNDMDQDGQADFGEIFDDMINPKEN